MRLTITIDDNLHASMRPDAKCPHVGGYYTSAGQFSFPTDTTHAAMPDHGFALSAGERTQQMHRLEKLEAILQAAIRDFYNRDVANDYGLQPRPAAADTWHRKGSSQQTPSPSSS